MTDTTPRRMVQHLTSASRAISERDNCTYIRTDDRGSSRAPTALGRRLAVSSVADDREITLPAGVTITEEA